MVALCGAGSLVQGKLRMNRNNHNEACVQVYGSTASLGKMNDDDFLVDGILIQVHYSTEFCSDVF